MIDAAPDTIDWGKMGGLVPAVVQDPGGAVLMVGFMNREALEATLSSGLVTFYSRSRARLWQKGETSGNRLKALAIRADCDRDALLVRAEPQGPTCHRGTKSCFAEAFDPGNAWLHELERIVARRAGERPQGSYTAKLLEAGAKRIGQKVGEEGVEVAIAAIAGDEAELAGEIADLLYHVTVLLRARGLDWAAVASSLRSRHREG